VKKPRILVVRGGAIGDFLMTLPAIGALRERWPEAQIEIVGYPHIIKLACGRHYADAVQPIEARAMAGFFVPRGILDPTLMEYFGGFNLVISYLFDPDSTFADNVRRCGARQVVEASARPSRECGMHAAEHYCEPLRSLAIYTTQHCPRVFPNDDDHAAAARFLRRTREPRVAVHPGSGSENKNWPVEKFAALSRWLVNELAAELLVVRGEADDAVVKRLLELVAPGSATVIHGLKLTELAAVVEQCALFLGNDSGITHLAAAVGTPTVAFYGPASLRIWEPRPWRTDGVRVVRFGPQDVAAGRTAIEELWAGRTAER
jgi:heptosyltransferase-2